jgi:hypothetical protein
MYCSHTNEILYMKRTEIVQIAQISKIKETEHLK